MIPKSAGEVLTGAIVRLGGYRDTTVDGIKVEGWMKMGMFEWTLCEVVASLSKCIPELDIMSD